MSSSLPSLEVSHSADKLIGEFYDQSETIIKKAKSADRLLTLAETKKLSELANAIRAIEATVDEGAIMAIFVRLSNYINKTDHEFGIRLITFMESYVHDMLDPLKQEI